MVRPVRLELTAPRLKGGCSTTELRALKNGQITSGFKRVRLNPTYLLYQIIRSVYNLFFHHPKAFYCDNLLYQFFVKHVKKFHLVKCLTGGSQPCYHIKKGFYYFTTRGFYEKNY